MQGSDNFDEIRADNTEDYRGETDDVCRKRLQESDDLGDSVDKHARDGDIDNELCKLDSVHGLDVDDTLYSLVDKSLDDVPKDNDEEREKIDDYDGEIDGSGDGNDDWFDIGHGDPSRADSATPDAARKHRRRAPDRPFTIVGTDCENYYPLDLLGTCPPSPW
mmetsp:Transcript_1857/g.5389  ORF Transcript_1857/g.5389 Transcript_1857/m.5389 type:complete len:163 (+) Transcript_1857:503-991(+)